MSNYQIGAEKFKSRLSDLCLKGGGTGLPRKEANKHILLKSISLTLEKDTDYSEGEFNEKLQIWLNLVGEKVDVDHVSLRRELVDARYIIRETDGSKYRLNLSGVPTGMFDPEIDGYDPEQIIAERKEWIEKKKQEYMK
ncbi:DUF2087 domain-containing protein [bacterium]|nr:DUF2087 domain-containing protein [bacterium]